MTEEFVTLQIMSWLRGKNWSILAFDFPQSGTGVLLHPLNSNSKNDLTIIPDILAINSSKTKGVLFENKDRYFFDDFLKIDKLKNTNLYAKDLAKIFEGDMPKDFYYGIGLPKIIGFIERAEEQKNKIDFLVTVGEDGKVETPYLKVPQIFDG